MTKRLRRIAVLAVLACAGPAFAADKAKPEPKPTAGPKKEPKTKKEPVNNGGKGTVRQEGIKPGDDVRTR